MTICYFGNYIPWYSRNRIIINGLRQNGVKVIECHSGLKGFGKYIDLFKKHWKIRSQYDILIVGVGGYLATVFARLLTRKKIIFNILVSRFDARVYDRKKSSTMNPWALYSYFLDWLSCHLADYVMLDTNIHIDYFVRLFKIKKDKFFRIFVGSDDKIFKPRELPNLKKDVFLVHFHGTCIPLQGITYILEAAKLLEGENVKFNIIGSKTKRRIKAGDYNNINFVDNVPYEKLSDYIVQADVCLGIFGDTDKANRVIPNKVYESLACQKAVITRGSGAARELFEDKKHCLFCKTADSRDLAEKILYLKSNKNLRDEISQNGYNLFKRRLTPKYLARELIKYVHES